MASVSHANVVAVHQVILVAGEVLVVMEYVEGQTLAAWLAAAPRSWRVVLDMFQQAGRGLEAAHAAGIVHRDFKPGNVLVGVDGRVRVTDFGLAGAEQAIDGPGAPVSPTGISEESTQRYSAVVAGTPAYMAPEQDLRQRVTAAADQFAFCVSLYEALYGERPFPGRTLDEIRSR